jgi:hypothetical protein
VDVQVLARAHYRRQARLALIASRASAREWRRLAGADLAGSWGAGAGLRILALVTAAQRAAADGSTDYVAAAVAAQGGRPDTQGLTVDAGAFAGIAADGRPLESLLFQPIVRTRQALADGTRAAEAMQSGLADLLRIVSTEVADAGRGAVGAAIAADRRVTGYVRVLNPPSCARCVLLAGKVYSWNRGFQRHPRCDCVHLPTIQGVKAHHVNPGAYFHSLPAAEQDRVFTAAGARAIRDGADIGQVVNARRSIYAVGEPYGRSRGLTATTEGMTKRGSARRRLKNLEAAGHAPARHRLTPDAIYRLASDREDAVRLLYRYGYLY